MTHERLHQLKELCEKATPGPWTHNPDFYDKPAVTHQNQDGRECSLFRPNDFDGLGHGKDADFIVSARTAIPELIAEVERLKEKLYGPKGYVRLAMIYETCIAPEILKTIEKIPEDDYYD